MKHTFLFSHALVLASLGLVASGCVSPEAHRRIIGANAALQAQMAQLVETMKTAAMENDRLLAEVGDLGARAADATWIENQKKRIGELLEKYGKDSPSAVPGIDLVPTPEGYAFRVAGGVLFSPGRADLSESGKKALGELTSALRGRKIRVEGHTDDTPINRSRWGTNLRLSVERAMAVADHLTKSRGLDANRVGVAGYGEYRPAFSGTDDASRQKNRRVEILLLDG